jgi:hypothetical protein
MARIKTYVSDVNVTGNDSWIGTDGDSFNRTKNFTPNKVANYLNSFERIDRSNTITFTYQTLDPGESRSFGTISFDSVQPSYVAFSGITNILVSKRSNGLKYVDVFLSGTNETTIILQRGNSVNEYGLYNVTAIEDYIDDTNFFVFTLEFIQGNGGLNEDKEYLFSVVDFSKGVQVHNELEGLNDGDYIHLTQEEKEKFDELPNSFATNTSDLINDGADGTSTYVETEELGAVAFSNDYNDLDNLPTIPTKTSDLINDSDFVSDANYVHTDNNFTNTLKSKLDGIQDGAEVNVNADWNATSGDAQILNKPTIPEAVTKTSDLINDGEDGVNPFITLEDVTNGTVTSVGLTMPSAFTVTNSPITSSGDIAVTGAGLVSQYVRGDGTLANFPNSTGGGSSVNYYLNGSVNQGTIGGVTYYQMSKTPILGAGTNFTRTNGAGNGYIASFITDAGDPSFLNIPGGNWNIEFYFQSSASGGSPQFYGEIYKVSATNVFTLIASGSTNPEGITNGTTVDQYYTSIPVPQTSLLITDRLAIRIYVITGGRTITLHTENGNLCEVLTTFTTGLTALNGLTQQVQYFNVGTGATNFNISSSGDTHTFNLLTNIRRNAQSGNINYCGYAPNGSLENQAVWTITKITVATNGSVTTTTSNNVTWTSVPF